MRVVSFIISTVVTVGLVIALNTKLGPAPPLGKFLSPQHGFWQNAEAADHDFNEELTFPDLKGKAEVYFDERLIPHIFAEEEVDAYFIQGYIHAKFRLWQMEFQTFAAAGRVSHVLGASRENNDSVLLNYDRSMRRLGMVESAKLAVEEINKNPIAKMHCDAYTAGVNAYIDQLNESQLPIEYKLLDYKPEHWSNLKTSLLTKYLSYDLAGHDEDMQFTNARSIFSRADFEALYPAFQDSLKPVVPNTAEGPYPSVPAFDMSIPATADSLYFTYRGDTVTNILPMPDKSNGSNNWAVSGSKTKSGSPILCNDPHLDLNLPSIWFEMQITTPTFNAYGVSFPGAPNVIIGFNDDIAFGFTNAGRDVKDYYEVRFRDRSMNEYWFDSAWVQSSKRIDTLEVRDGAPMYDTVVTTIFGPVIYDHNFPSKLDSKKYYAVKWKANDPSNEIMLFYQLNHAKNYDDYAEAIKYLSTPGQNPVFAAKDGDIALWQQGDFPAKWRRQGDFIMPGEDSTFLWKGIIPQGENPHMRNPARGYVSSANQLSVDSSYPYYTGNDFPVYRGYMINRYLDSMQQITPADMQKLQMDNYLAQAEFSKDILIQTDEGRLSQEGRKYFGIYKTWNYRDDAQEKGATVYDIWWKEFEKAVWADEIDSAGLPLPWPNETTLIEGIHKDSAYRFIDNILTPQKETLQDLLIASLKKAADELRKVEADGNLEWAKYKSTRVQHLLKLPAFSRLHLPAGGGVTAINSTKRTHGPSWRMVVQLSAITEAYGVYPGGQNGNPGSKYYDNFVDSWAKGEYYRLWVMKHSDGIDKKVKWTMKFNKG